MTSQMFGRSRAGIVAMAMIAVTLANADTKLKVKVAMTGQTLAGMGAGGEYEIDYKGAMARVVQPDGVVALIDFASSKVAILNASSKTYGIRPLSDFLKSAGAKDLATLRIVSDSTAATGTAAGLTVTRAGLTGKGGAVSAVDANTGNGTSSAVLANLKGEAWLASQSQLKDSLASIAPLVIVGAPPTVRSALLAALESRSAIPMGLAFHWSAASGGGSSGTTMTVTSIDNATLSEDTVRIPEGYRYTDGS